MYAYAERDRKLHTKKRNTDKGKETERAKEENRQRRESQSAGRLYHYLYHELLLPGRSLLIAHNRQHREPRYPGSYVRITKLMGNFALGFMRVAEFALHVRGKQQ